MSATEQSEVVTEVEGHGRGKARRLRELGISRSTYYWWRQRQGSWEDTEKAERPWNRLRPEEEGVVLAVARETPEWRSRQLAAYLTDHRALAVSASTVYRILRREGLVKRVEYQLAAGKEYRHKTTGPKTPDPQLRPRMSSHCLTTYTVAEFPSACHIGSATNLGQPQGAGLSGHHKHSATAALPVQQARRQP